MSIFLISLMSGFFATLCMVGVMDIITKSKLANADMVRAIGSIFTKNYENSFKPGLILHFLSGLIFTTVYFAAFKFFLLENTTLAPVVGLVGGFFHGMFITLLLVNLVAKYHPLSKFKETGFYMATAHVVGHMVFGLALGLIYYLSIPYI